jgi:hypothetical protein
VGAHAGIVPDEPESGCDTNTFPGTAPAHVGTACRVAQQNLQFAQAILDFYEARVLP